MENTTNNLRKRKNSVGKITLSASKIILAVLWETGKITTQSFFPPQYAKKYGYTSLYRNYYRNSLYGLKRRGVVEKTSDGIYRLTKQGEEEAFFAYLNTESKVYKPEKQKWDKKWRIVFFDVPEKKRCYRDYLRTILKTVGFKEFQKSTWIFPYHVPKLIKDMLFEENIKRYTRFITTYDIEYDKDLKRMFDL